LLNAFGNTKKRIRRQALIEFEIDGVSYELVFVVAPNVVPDAILKINFLKETNVVMNLTEGRFRTRMDGFNCEHKFFYDSLPKSKVGVQLKFSESQTTIRQNGKDYTVTAQTTHALMSVPK